VRLPRRWSLRREAPVLLPVVLALFALLALATLLRQRGALERLEAEARARASTIVERLAGDGAPHTEPELERLVRLLPPGSSIAVLDADRRVRRMASGVDSSFASVLQRPFPASSGTLGPLESGRPSVLAWARIGADDGWVVVEIAEHGLAAERRAGRRWTLVVVLLTGAAALVSTLWVIALLRPYDALVSKARQAGGAAPGAGEDELEFVLATFDRALEAMGAPEGDLEPFADTLGASLDGGFLLLDAAGNVVVSTPAASELLEIETPAPGTPLETALQRVPHVAAALATAVRGDVDAPPRGRLRLPSTSGAPSAVGYTVEPLRGSGGRPRGWLVVLADWSDHDRDEARERVADGLAQLGQLSAGVAHELRNGLAAILGWSDLARRQLRNGGASSHLDEIERESRQLARVVDEFLAFARPGSRTLVDCDLLPILRRVCQDPSLTGSPIEVDAAVPAAPLRGDADLLERAVRNLVSNALAAQSDAGTDAPVRLEVERRGAAWELRVLDRGVGFPESLRERAFEPFVSSRPGGVGLGLAFARRVFLLHGGSLAVEPRADGGTAAVGILPAGDSDTKRSDPARPGARVDTPQRPSSH